MTHLASLATSYGSVFPSSEASKDFPPISLPDAGCVHWSSLKAFNHIDDFLDTKACNGIR
jgi:hypothetical protein